MLKIFSIVAVILAGRQAACRILDLSEEGTPWRRDPLAHPALCAMNQAELGDLPIGHPVLREPAAC